MIEDSQPEPQSDEELHINPEVHETHEEIEDIGETAVEGIVSEDPIQTSEASENSVGIVEPESVEQTEVAEPSHESLSNYDTYKKIQAEISDLARAPIVFTREAEAFNRINLEPGAEDPENQSLSAQESSLVLALQDFFMPVHPDGSKLYDSYTKGNQRLPRGDVGLNTTDMIDDVLADRLLGSEGLEKTAVLRVTSNYHHRDRGSINDIKTDRFVPITAEMQKVLEKLEPGSLDSRSTLFKRPGHSLEDTEYNAKLDSWIRLIDVDALIDNDYNIPKAPYVALVDYPYMYTLPDNSSTSTWTEHLYVGGNTKQDILARVTNSPVNKLSPETEITVNGRKITLADFIAKLEPQDTSSN